MYKGRLVQHLRRSEWGTGIILATRTKEKFDRDGGGLFVHQLKVAWPAGGRGWFDRDVLRMLGSSNTIGDAFVRPRRPL